MGDMPVTEAEFFAELAIRADPQDVRRAAIWLEQTGTKIDMPAEQVRRLDHCMEEALANVIDHGGEQARAGSILLRLEATRRNRMRIVSVTVIDAGTAINPLLIRARPVHAPLKSMQPGGLGLLLMRSYSDEIDYHYNDNRNHLTFVVRWPEAQ
jgi:anti-sigma regulatory factor (Ser/Thr protein kinase)